MTIEQLDLAESIALNSGAGTTFQDGVSAMRTAIGSVNQRSCWSTGDTECVSPLVCRIYGCKLMRL